MPSVKFDNSKTTVSIDKTVSAHSELHLGAVSTISSFVFLCCDHLLCDNEKSPLPNLRDSREVIDATEPLYHRHHWDAVAKRATTAS